MALTEKEIKAIGNSLLPQLEARFATRKELIQVTEGIFQKLTEHDGRFDEVMKGQDKLFKFLEDQRHENFAARAQFIRLEDRVSRIESPHYRQE